MVALNSIIAQPLAANETHRFSEGNLFVRVLENVRGRDVFIVQGTEFPANDNFVELLFWIDAFKRASAASVTAVIPYFSYAKGDKKDEPRVSIRARVCADAIEAAGADRVVTMDLHAPQVQGFFKIPVDDLYAMPVLCDAIARRRCPNLVVVAPDAGFAKKARAVAQRLGAPMAIADKGAPTTPSRPRSSSSSATSRGRTALHRRRLHDLRQARSSTRPRTHRRSRRARDLRRRDAWPAHRRGHERLDGSPIERLFITDTVETQPLELPTSVEVLSVAALFGEAIRRIYPRQSISVLFEVTVAPTRPRTMASSRTASAAQPASRIC